MKSVKSSFLFGLVLIVIGGFLLLKSLDLFNFRWDTLGALIMIAFGLFQLGAWWFNKKNYGLIFPGTLMLIYGGIFLICSMNTWNLLDHLWPLFIIAPSIGFILMYFLGKKETGVLVTGLILLAAGLIFLAQNYFFFEFWPVIL